MPEENKTDNTLPVKKSWLEKQLEKIIGEHENMQPFIRTYLSIAGFIGGFVTGYWVLGKEKDRKIEAQRLELMELKEDNREKEKELRNIRKELEESKEKQLRLEAELKVSKERDTQEHGNRELSGVIPLRRIERSYLD